MTRKIRNFIAYCVILGSVVLTWIQSHLTLVIMVVSGIIAVVLIIIYFIRKSRRDNNHTSIVRRNY